MPRPLWIETAPGAVLVCWRIVSLHVDVHGAAWLIDGRPWDVTPARC